MNTRLVCLMAAGATAVSCCAQAEAARLPDSVALSASLVSETAWNVSGGDRRTASDSGQFAIAAAVDAEKAFGVPGGTLQAVITYRWGEELGAVAGLHTLQEVQEIYGRGQTWRLTHLWYQQQLGAADLKLGRLTIDEDFASFRCAFQNLTFCGAQPGNIATDYWYNWPAGQWGARGRLRHGEGYAQLGAYEVNPRNLEKDFTIGHFDGATGVMIPVEAGWAPSLRGRPGSYKLGAWYDTSRASDVQPDANQPPGSVSGAPPRSANGRGGVYLLAQQQLTGTAENGRTASGVTIFLNITQMDRRTSRLDRQVTAGAFWLGPLAARPRDELGVALGATHVNARLAQPGFGDAGSEYLGEIYYAAQVNRWLTLQPDLQFIGNPGGASRRGVVVLGLKGSLTFAP